MKDKQGGFTIIELMFTVIVLAVLLGLGVPNFRDFLRNSRMTAAANDLLTDFNLARSEAIKRRVAVTLCRSSNGTACATAGNFTGWIVFVDDANPAATSSNDANGQVNTGETVLKYRTIEAGITGTTDTSLARRLVYMPTGFPNTALGGRITRIVFCDERGSAETMSGVSAARGVIVNPTGHVSVTRNYAKITDDVGDGGFGGCPNDP